MKTNQMNGLYPIIRRVRRPLLPVEPLQAANAADAKPAVEEREKKPKQSDGETPGKKHGEVGSSQQAA